jgi:hypothetical protein
VVSGIGREGPGVGSGFMVRLGDGTDDSFGLLAGLGRARRRLAAEIPGDGSVRHLPCSTGSLSLCREAIGAVCCGR